MPKFSIVIVCLNAGEKLLETVESIRRQTCRDYEILVKDGGSVDGSIERLKQEQTENMVICSKPDSGIYDAMNQAAAYITGEYVLFLNCGDSLYKDSVLQEMAENIEGQKKECRIYYGDLYESLTDTVVSSNPHMDAFGCYRNVPCHQTCFYDASLFRERGYNTAYAVRADYEHFLWSFFVKKAVPVHVPIVVASYEGGGFSETKENRKRSAAEHKEIVGKYMSAGELFRFRLLLIVTLAPLRTKIAQSRRLSGVYNSLKKRIYGK